MNTITLIDAIKEEVLEAPNLPDGYYYVPNLGRTDYGGSGEILMESNAIEAERILNEVGGECIRHASRTWACNTYVFAVNLTTTEVQEALSEILSRLENYPLLNEDLFGELEHQAHVDKMCEDSCSLCEYANQNKEEE